MSQERVKSGPGQINCNDLNYCIYSYVLYFAKFEKGIWALADQIFKKNKNIVDVCLMSGRGTPCFFLCGSPSE